MEPGSFIVYFLLTLDSVLVLGLLTYTIARWRSPKHPVPAGIMFLVFAAGSVFAWLAR